MKDEDDLTDLYDKYINTASSWDTGDHPKVMVLPNRISEEASGHVRLCGIYFVAWSPVHVYHLLVSAKPHLWEYL